MKRLFLFFLVIYCGMANMWAQHNHGHTYAYQFSPIKQTRKLQSIPPNQAEKPIIDSTAVKQWVSLGSNYDLAISNDGQYFAYFLQTLTLNKKTLVIQSTSNKWIRQFPNASPGFFSKDNKQYIFQTKDTLCFLSLGTEYCKYLTGVLDYSQPALAKGEWLAWLSIINPGELVLYNLLTRDDRRYSSVAAFAFSKTGKGLLLKRTSRKDTASVTELQLVRLPKKEEPITIWSAKDSQSTLNNFTLDDSGTQVTFMTGETELHSALQTTSQPQSIIWYYKTGMKTAVQKVNNQSNGIPAGLQIQEAPEFSDNGHYIILGLQAIQPIPKPNAVKLDVWHYADIELQSLQLKEEQPQMYTAVINIESNKLICLQRDNEISPVPPKRDFMVFTKNMRGDRFWLPRLDTNWLVSLSDGSRTLLKTVGHCDFWFSPGGNYLVYTDAGQQGNYFSYNLKTGKTTNLSATIPVGSLSCRNEFEPSPKRSNLNLIYPVGIGGWIYGDTGLVVYDNYDLWQLDLTGKTPPINVTGGYGRTHNIKFRLAEEQNRDLIIKPQKPLLLTAYNAKTKYNGFFEKSLQKTGVPTLLTMGPYSFCLEGPNLYTPNGIDFDPGLIPRKAENSNLWIVKRQSTEDAPNYFITSDFIDFKPLTNLQPHKSYNWLTAELISFQQLDGTISQGILYKPENFDSTKKYPILFNYYEQLSHRLYQYARPDFTRTNINVAWFVSRGYLVFTPDIYNDMANRGLSAYNAVVGAAQHLSKLPFVDVKKMGINGHSVGGGLTNYIITHTNIFAAAIEGAGISDLISSSLQLSNDRSRLVIYDIHKGSLWENKDSWLTDSPIMEADKITTPLIIFHSKKDAAVPWEQAVELFIALRRLGKRVWMLQYDNGNHGVWGRDCEDYTVRITQFFDHYLKGTPPPVWMTKGIPAKLKGIDDGLELDTEYATPTIAPVSLSGH